MRKPTVHPALRWLSLWPLYVFLIACALAGATAQHYQPDLGLLDCLSVPKWAEAVAGLSFLVVVIRCFASWRLHLALQTAMVLMLCPLTGFVSAIAGAPDAAFANSAAQVEQYLHGLFSFVSTGVPFLVALTMLVTPDMQRRLMGSAAD